MKKLMQSPRPAVRLAAESIEPEYFDLRATQPTTWLSKATELRRAAQLVANGIAGDLAATRAAHEGQHVTQKPPALDGVWFHLLATMLENVFKGLLVARSKSWTQEPRKKGHLDKALKGHDLVKLAERASLALSDEERAFADLASNATISWGRYPVSVTHHELRLGLTYKHAAVEQIAERLYARAGAALIAELRACGWTFKHGNEELIGDATARYMLYGDPPPSAH
ncbi:MAG: hypothetical protein JO257_21930 [Deltaproteobacteria bacterium]|nr:hypothetical protein [Deltaproteobacteria bacterium]